MTKSECTIARKQMNIKYIAALSAPFTFRTMHKAYMQMQDLVCRNYTGPLVPLPPSQGITCDEH